MEGTLSVPPEKNLISRGNWKNRYVVLGPRKLLGNTSAPKKPATPEIGYLDDDMSGIDDVFENQSEDFFQPRFPSSDVRLSIYRSRLDPDPLVSYPIECITSCYVGDIAHRKAFGSISKTTYSPICPTLIVNVQLEPSSMSRRRMTMDSPTSSIAQFYDTDDKLTIFFRPGPKDTPPLTAWAREIQNNLRTSQSRRSSAVTFGLPDRRHRDSFRAVPYDLKIAEDEWEEELANQQAVGQLTTRSSEESGSRSGGSGHSEHGVTSPMPTMHEFEHRGSVSAADSPIDPQELSPGMGHGEYMAYASVASSPGRRETILDRAFSMNYIPASPSNSTTTPSFYPHANPNITSVARFEALAADPGMPRNTNNNRYKGLDLDPSVMPASFFSSHQ